MASLPHLLLPAMLAVTSSTAWPQQFSFGFIGGTNLTRDFPISRTMYADLDYPAGLTTFDLFSEGHTFMAGLSAEVYFRHGLSLEANAIHRNLQLRRRFIFPDQSVSNRGEVQVSTWQFPLLLKYRLPAVGTFRPFVAGGPSFRTRHNPAPTEPSQFGATIGAGVELQAGRLRLSPSIRFTRWQYDGNYPRIATKRDQFEFTTGVSYATSPQSWKIGSRKLRLGLIGGSPFTDGLAQSNPLGRIEEEFGYIAGLVAEFPVNDRLSMEINGLYRPFRAHAFSTDIPAGTSVASFEFTVLTWQFPLLAKYRFSSRAKFRPLVEAGPSFRLSGNKNGGDPSHIGFSAGVGVETDYRALRITPVVRYTRWARDTLPLYAWPRSARNQLELLASFTF